LQTDALNELHPSTLICPITTNVQTKSFILRVHLPKGTAGLRENCDIMIDQLRAIDNRRLIKKIGTIPVDVSKKIRYNIRIVLDLE
jgi:mRNA interferase MazF